MNYLGIDPGLNGGMCIIDDNGNIIDSIVMPTFRDPKGKRIFDAQGIYKWIQSHNYASPVSLAGIEKPIPMPRLPSNVLLSLGYGNGVLVGIMTALLIPFQMVRAQEWQKKILTSVTAGTTKQRSIQYAQQMQPKYDWRENERCRVAHDGLADAFCIAKFISSPLPNAF